MAQQEATDTQDQNTEKQAPIVDQTWQDGFTEESLSIPYKREEAKEEPKAKETEQENTEEAEEEIPQAEAFNPEPTLEDPGDYEPKDYSFEIEIDGKKHTVASAEEADELADKFAEKLNAKELGTLIRKGAQIEIKQERDKTEWEKSKEAYDAQAAENNQLIESINSIANEFEYMVGKGFIPPVADEYKNADWNDPKIAQQDGVKEQKEILDYMFKENKDREKAGLKPLTSVLDAYNAMQLDVSKQSEKAKEDAAKQARKDAGARVASTTATPPGTNKPKGVAVGRVINFRNNSSVWED